MCEMPIAPLMAIGKKRGKNMKAYLRKNKILLLMIFLIGMIVAFGTVYLAIILQDIVNIATEGDAKGFSIALLRAGIYLVY